MIEFSEWAVEILQRSQSAAARFNPSAKIRLERTSNGVAAVLTEEPDPADTPTPAGEVTVFVEAGLEGLVDIEEPHDRVVLRPAGSAPNTRGEH